MDGVQVVDLRAGFEARYAYVTNRMGIPGSDTDWPVMEQPAPLGAQAAMPSNSSGDFQTSDKDPAQGVAIATVLTNHQARPATALAGRKTRQLSAADSPFRLAISRSWSFSIAT